MRNENPYNVFILCGAGGSSYLFTLIFLFINALYQNKQKKDIMPADCSQLYTFTCEKYEPMNQLGVSVFISSWRVGVRVTYSQTYIFGEHSHKTFKRVEWRPNTTCGEQSHRDIFINNFIIRYGQIPFYSHQNHTAEKTFGTMLGNGTSRHPI